jgi:hypothetical protein
MTSLLEFASPVPGETVIGGLNRALRARLGIRDAAVISGGLTLLQKVGATAFYNGWPPAVGPHRVRPLPPPQLRVI